MKLIHSSFFLFLTFVFSNAYAQSIVVVNIQYLIDSNINYIEKIKNLEINQSKYLKDFERKEENLNKLLKDIENAKLIINENEINNQIDNYNQQLQEFSIMVEEFNFHYKNQIILIREQVLKEIIILLENYAIKNQVDLILDSANYLIASNSINITEDIKKMLDQIKIKLEYKDFEKN